jgi:hypothetical protein
MANQAIKGGMKAYTRKTTTKVNKELLRKIACRYSRTKWNKSAKKETKGMSSSATRQRRPRTLRAGMSYPILLYITVQRHPTGACHVENLFDQLI